MKLVEAEPSCIAAVVFLVVVWTICGRGSAEGELHWQSPKKEQMRVRLIALAAAYPRSSFFANQEVFVAEKQLGEGEWRLVKLVYGYLPYQPPLSEYGLDYSTVHELSAIRDPSCDEMLSQMTSPDKVGKWPRNDQTQSNLKYSTDSPLLNLERRRTALPCYETTAEDFSKSVHVPGSTPRPELIIPNR